MDLVSDQYGGSRLVPGSTGKAGIPINLQAEVIALKSRVDQQNLLLQTLLRLLLSKGAIGKAEFKDLMERVDELDGTRDGRLRGEKGTKTCPKCQRVSSINAVQCQYCGEDYPPQEFISHEAQDAS